MSLKVAYSDDIQVITKSLILKTLQPFYFIILFIYIFFHFSHFIFPPLPDSLFPSLYTSQLLHSISAVVVDRAGRAIVGTNWDASARCWRRSQRFSSPNVRDTLAHTIPRRFSSHHLVTLPTTLHLPPNWQPFTSHHNW